MTHNVLVFRKRLLAYSETFIADQGQYLPNMQAIFTGFKTDKSGLQLLDGKTRCLQQEHALHAGLARLRLRMGMGLNRRWRQALQSYKPQLIHAHFGPDAAAALPIAEELSIPLLATFHGFDITKGNRNAAYIAQREQVFQRSAIIIAVSNYIKHQLIEAGCPEHKIRQHYIGIDTEYFSGDKQEHEQPSILFVGRLVHKKGCRYLLEAMNAVQSKIPEARLLIAGDGPLREELEQQASGLNHVSFLGVQSKEQIKQLLQEAWVFCTPSIVADSGDAEGLGMVFLEAQALGTPAVSFDSGGVVEAIEHGKTGFNIPEKNVTALSDHLLQLLSDDQMRQEFGRAGIERVVRDFNIRQQCAKLEEIYQEALG